MTIGENNVGCEKRGVRRQLTVSYSLIHCVQKQDQCKLLQRAVKGNTAGKEEDDISVESIDIFSDFRKKKNNLSRLYIYFGEKKAASGKIKEFH